MLDRIRNATKKTGCYGTLRNIYWFLLHPINSFYNLFFPTTIVLLYHRIAEVKDDPHRLSVSPAIFEKQLIYLKENYKVINLRTLVQNIKDKKIERNTVVITFDDGYVDNLDNALPILTKLNLPATIFVTAGKLDDPSAFFWDENTKQEDRGRALSTEELIRLSKSPLIEIGSHTMNHPHLADLPNEDQAREISNSKKELESILKNDIFGFAYPFGSKKDFSDQTVKLARESDYNYACANFPDRAKSSTDIFSIPRVVIRDWDISEFSIRLKRS